ncbi:helix-turn-helix domain-containing protein [Botrimarina hoheduenensis]|uniref:HTH cro/C1-type domain-containing protein n=1 Tax=Botrimarina hoheduenensis TaxID=2528000 RepID=A0A5C5W9H9_9BACT|nr:helix-turn-helix transcriptional regulator [Botrimarina hoheduenensis]TWT47274.1 hypothetical protein Pla111_08870 [Botrimarina hoheduenensis]
MNATDSYTMGGSFVPGPLAGGTAPERSEIAPSTSPATSPVPQPSGKPTKRRFHRIAKIRQQQGLSVRSAARRMGVPMEQVRREEKPDANLSLADLIRWQEALEVPLIDLLVEDTGPLSAPVMARARWLRLMKTVKALMESNASEGVTRMAEMLQQQVLEVMPELDDVTAWHSVGQRRTQDESGRIAERPVSRTFASDALR